MTNLTVVAEQDRAPSPFAIAMLEWRNAQAALAALEVKGCSDDATMDACLQELTRTEWKLLQTPASKLFEIKERGRVVLEMLAAADFSGRPTDNRHHLMVSRLVSDLLRCTPKS